MCIDRGDENQSQLQAIDKRHLFFHSEGNALRRTQPLLLGCVGPRDAPTASPLPAPPTLPLPPPTESQNSWCWKRPSSQFSSNPASFLPLLEGKRHQDKAVKSTEAPTVGAELWVLPCTMLPAALLCFGATLGTMRKQNGSLSWHSQPGQSSWGYKAGADSSHPTAARECAERIAASAHCGVQAAA